MKLLAIQVISGAVSSVVMALIEEASYSVNETTQTVEVCVVLEGRIERDVILDLFTEDDSATGMYYL